MTFQWTVKNLSTALFITGAIALLWYSIHSGMCCYVRSYIAVAVILSALLMSRYFMWKSMLREFVPGKAPSFFDPLGTTADVYSVRVPPGCEYHFDTAIMLFFERYLKAFKKPTMFSIWLFRTPMVFAVKAEAVEEIIGGTKFVDKAWFYNWLHPMIGTGLITSFRKKWKSRRKLLNPCFNYAILKNFVPVMNEQTQVLLKRFKEETSKDFTDIFSLISACTLDVICETMMGIDVGMQTNSKDSKLIQLLNRAYQLIIRRLKRVHLWSDFTYSFTKDYKEMQHIIQSLDEFTNAILQETRKKYLTGELSANDGKRKSLMHLLLEHHLQEKDLNEDGIREEMNTFMLAGSDTTAQSMTWALYLVGLYPEIQAKVHEEIDSIFGSDTESHVTEENMKDMKYSECVLKESHRIYPAIPLFARNIEEDSEICGYKVYKDTPCVVLTYFLHRDEDVFPNPEKFDPNRFLPENSVNRHPYSFVPFAAGPRSCIGQRFAMMEQKIMFAHLMRNFSFESLDSRDKVLPACSIFLKPSRTIRIKVRPRFQQSV